MDAMILAGKLEWLRRCVARVEARRAATPAALAADVDVQDIVTLNLTRAIQLCVDASAHVLADADQPTPSTMGEAFDLLAAEGVIDAALASRLRGAVGFRNLAVHACHPIDWAIVHRLTYEGLDDLRLFAERVGRLIE
jgi:uncharacterized protein YutE (UPF0331/DUF86 family)